MKKQTKQYRYKRRNSSAFQDSQRNSSMNALNNLRDNTQQAASAVRQQRNTTVQTVRQNENSTVATEVVANHNHCHAITMEYFEVLAHYLINTDYVEAQECLFIPMWMNPFTKEMVFKYSDILKRVCKIAPSHSAYKGFEAI